MMTNKILQLFLNYIFSNTIKQILWSKLQFEIKFDRKISISYFDMIVKLNKKQPY